MHNKAIRYGRTTYLIAKSFESINVKSANIQPIRIERIKRLDQERNSQ